MTEIYMNIITFVFGLIMVAFLNHLWKRSRISNRTKTMISALALSSAHLAAFASLLWIVAPRIPEELRDGWFGLGVGIISAACIVGVIFTITTLFVDTSLGGCSKFDKDCGSAE
jgi:hypothetical protein